MRDPALDAQPEPEAEPAPRNPYASLTAEQVGKMVADRVERAAWGQVARSAREAGQQMTKQQKAFVMLGIKAGISASFAEIIDRGYRPPEGGVL